MTGAFNGLLELGGGTLAGGNSDGFPGMFIAKFSPTGEHVWSATGLQAIASGIGIAVGPGSAIGLTGYFGGKLDLGGGPIDSSSLYTPFVAELAP